MLRIRAISFSFICFVGLVPLAFAEELRADDLVIKAPWARASIGISRPSAAYLVIRNNGGTKDVLTGIETPVALMAEVHKSEMKDGVSKMAPAGPIEIPSRGFVRLAPRGFHIMLMKLKQPLMEGDDFPIDLIFKKAGRVEVNVPIRGIGATSPNE